MGNDLQSYRVSIGSFYCKVYGMYSLVQRYFITFNFDIFRIAAKLLNTVNRKIVQNLENIQFILLLCVLLLLCNDIAENPGPQSEEVKGFSIFHLNVRSIRNKLSDIEHYLDEYDIACFTETHLDASIPTDSLLFSNFESPFRRDRTNHGGGLLVYIRSGITAKRRTDLENDNDETIWIEMINKKTKILLCCLYRPVTCRHDLWDRLEQSVSLALETSQHIVLCGDWNINFSERLPVRVHTFLSLFNFNNVISEATRITDSSSTCIDPIIIPDTINLIESGTIDVNNLSDHRATYIVLDFDSTIPQKYTRTIWIYNDGNYENMINEIESTDWEFLSEDSDIENSVSTFSNKLMTIIEHNIPRKNVLIRPLDRAWFNSDIRREIRKRDRLRKTYRRTHNERDFQKYKILRNKINNMKKKLKEEYIYSMNNSLQEYKQTNIKLYWKLIKSLLNGNKQSNDFPTMIYEGEAAFTDDSKCDLFNDYFCSVSSNCDENHDLPNFDSRTDAEIHNVDITAQEIIDQIKILDPKKACGPDVFSHIMLKKVCNAIAFPLSIIFNKSIELGKFPSHWKHAHVLPIHKKGDKSTPSNYRPISLLSCIGKLFERVMFKHLYNHLHANNLLYDLQSGFRPGHSTVTQLIEMYHQICLAIDNREFSCFTFCDISKAFDRVWIKGLIYKLEKYGFKGRILAWISDYLSNRTQQVKLKNSVSSVGFLKSGVPQGSVLGPLLFLTYINDIPDGLHGLTRLFADDTSNSHTSNDLVQIQDENNHDLLKITQWAHDWLVDFNPQKTKVMIFGSRQTNRNSLNFLFDGETLLPSNIHQHLGVVFSNDAKWSDHVDFIISRVSKQISVLRKLKYQLSKNFLSNIYVTFIRPTFEYASEVWDNITIYDSERLEKFQLEAGRIVTGLPLYSSRASIYFETGWEILKTRRQNKKLCLMYKIYNNLVPNYLSDLVPDQVGLNNPYNLRNSDNISIPMARTSLFQSSFIPSTIKAWNNLPVSTRQSATLSQFKNKLKAIPPTRPSFFDHGDRKLNILHTRLRHGCSSLNGDLYRVNLLSDSSCSCGAPIENAEHFFFNCRKYQNIRDELFSKIIQLGATIDIRTFLYGDTELSIRTNIKVFDAIHKYISLSKRF
ncbi:hypothetical protein FSP39_019145 [Pinctada imbricata]|uniref:Reverse transcriptase domain-containing protein n=1 Tax=Pinctada imbricata TaxID=66713 RepID=A0AA89BZ07_PINIB|nr:hypothetical protein FSP39_019145 [Pinctada imbricata]